MNFVILQEPSDMIFNIFTDPFLSLLECLCQERERERERAGCFAYLAVDCVYASYRLLTSIFMSYMFVLSNSVRFLS